jgi:hypothetical protein
MLGIIFGFGFHCKQIVLLIVTIHCITKSIAQNESLR